MTNKIEVHDAEAISDALHRIGQKIKNNIEQERIRAESIMEQADIAEEAWDEWDVQTLLAMGYITQSDADLINAEQKRDCEEFSGSTIPHDLFKFSKNTN